MNLLLFLPLLLESQSFTFNNIPDQIAGDSFYVSIQSSNPDSFGGTGELSLLPEHDFFEVVGSDDKLIDFVDGNWDGYVRIFRASDSIHLNCYVYGLYEENPSNDFAVSHNSPERLQVLLPGENTDPGNVNDRGRYGIPDYLRAGADTTCRIFITDEFWNRVGTGSEEVNLQSDNPFPSLPPPMQTVAGSLEVSFNLRTAGSDNHLFAFHNPAGAETLMTDTSTTFSVLPGNFTRLLLRAPGMTLLPGDTLQQPTGSNYPGVQGTPSNQTAGLPFTVNVYAVDSCWNRVNTAPQDEVRVWAYGYPQIDSTGTLVSGSADFSIVSNTGGVLLPLQAEDVTSNYIEDAYTVPVQISGSHYSVSVSPDSVVSGGSIQLSISYLDADSNLISDADNPIYLRAVDASSPGMDASGYISPEDTVIYLQGGRANRNIQYYTQQDEQILIRVRDSLAVTGYSEPILVRVAAGGDKPLASFPNPFGREIKQTTIYYYLNQDADVLIKIYDKFGNLVWSKEEQGEGGTEPNIVFWRGVNNSREFVSSGVYMIFVRATTRTKTVAEYTGKIAVIR